jgi:hypothetical protein
MGDRLHRRTCRERRPLCGRGDSHFDAKARLAQAVIERDFALDEQGRVEVALAELRQSLHGCLNAGGMTTPGRFDGRAFRMACSESERTVMSEYCKNCKQLADELAALREKCDTLLADNYSLRAELEKRK